MGKDFDDLAAIKPEGFEVKKDSPLEIEAKGLSHKGTIKPFDLEIHKGEVVGLTGLLGSGRSELARAIYGADKAQTGTLKVDAVSYTHLENSAVVAHIFEVIAKIAAQEGLDAGFRVITNSGKAAGQTVPHLHFHILAGVDMAEKLI